MRPLPPLNALLTFEVASRHLSFTKASRELNVTQGAVSRQIAALEEYFGEPLFVRRNNGIALTAGAAEYAAALQAAFDKMRAATKSYVSAADRPVLTVKGYTLLLGNWLMPRLPAFNREYPRIDIRLIATSGASHVDFAKDAVDVGIRYGRGHWSGLNSHLLFRDELVPVCSPSLAKKEQLRSPQDLIGRTLLETHARSQDWPDWFATAGVSIDAKRGRTKSFEDLGLVHRCAVDGLGIALLQRAYIEEDLAAGRLIIPCESILARPLGYHLVYPSERAGVPKISSFRDWLLGLVAQTQP
jgi:LysR family transcriptional regulator, glycine cleavage system transcriptional activator